MNSRKKFKLRIYKSILFKIILVNSRSNSKFIYVKINSRTNIKLRIHKSLVFKIVLVKSSNNNYKLPNPFLICNLRNLI